MKRSPLILVLAAVPRLLAGQATAGSIEGTVRIAGSDQPVAEARVLVTGIDIATVTARDGSYRIDAVPAGERTLQVQKQGFVPGTSLVSVEEGAVARADILLVSRQDSRTMVIEGERLRASEEVTLQEVRVDTTGIKDVISTEDMARQPGGRVDEVAKSSPGVTFRGAFAYIRGLGERYSQTLVNGSQMPSPEPDKRVVPLDLFPTNVVERIAIVKSYSADLPGEFSGGSVQITTRDIPEEDFLDLGFSLKYVHGTTFRDFATYHGGNLDLFGFDDGTRSLPSAVPAGRVIAVGPTPPPPGQPGFSDAEVQAIGRSFPNIWNRNITTAAPDHKVNMSFGKKLGDVDEGTAELGIVGTVNWENSYQTIDDESFILLKNNGSIQNPDLVEFNTFDIHSSVFESRLSGLLNLVFRPYQAQKVGLRSFFSHNSEDLTRFQEGFDAQRGAETRIIRLRYQEKTLYLSELFGEHLLDGGPLGDMFLEWHGSYALSQADSPDDRQVRYQYEDSLGDYRFEEVSRSGSRNFYLLDENIYNLGFDLSIPFSPSPFYEPPPPKDPEQLAPDQKIKFGASYVLRDRDFDSRHFRFLEAGADLRDENGNPILRTASPEDLFRPANINPDGFILNEDTRATDNYDAEWSILAGYALTDFRIIEPLRFEAGVRLEASDQDVNTFEIFSAGDPDVVSADVSTLDFLPGGSLVYDLFKRVDEQNPDKELDKLQVRLSASQTVTRPEFRELAKFEFTDLEGGYSTVGNPELERTEILNLDLRFDWFLQNADLLSLSLFYKDFTNPIEQIILETGSTPLRTWQNADSAYLLGVELEARKSLDFLAWIHEDLGVLEDFRLLFNLTYIESEVRLSADQSTVQTNDKRPLQGQPEYIVNFGLLYESSAVEGWTEGLSFGVFANTFGDRITAVGAFGLPDQIEDPRWSLDLLVAKKIGQSTISLSARNILDDEYEIKQGDFTTQEYHLGWTVSLAYSHRF